MPPIHGLCDPRFQKVKDQLEEYLSSGEEVGASITVNIDGQDKINIWGGWVDQERKSEWKEDTIVNVFSSTKTIVSLAILILVERGLVDLNEKVCKYWPEFAAAGKENIEIRHIISHTSGLCGWDEPLSVEDLYDWEKTTSALARQAPWWEPGTASGYHSLTMGYLGGEIVRRTTGQTFKQFVAEEIAKPLQADFQIGLRSGDLSRVSDILPPVLPAGTAHFPLAPMTAKTFANPPFSLDVANTADWRKADIGAANGHGNASGLSRMISVIAQGGTVNGVQLLSPATIDKIFQQQAHGSDQVLGIPVRIGTGYGIAGEASSVDWLPNGRVCYWGGAGGSLVIADVDRRMTITYAMNKLIVSGFDLGGARGQAYVTAIYAALRDDNTT